MSALVCSISGAPLNHGVISSKTGHLYEKSTILHYIALNKSCPHTGIPLQPRDIIQLTPSNTFILPSQPNIPQIVQKLQSQMDALIYETHFLKQNLRQRREELAISLYRQDASIRVISKLQQQRNRSRENIGSLMQEIRLLQNK